MEGLSDLGGDSGWGRVVAVVGDGGAFVVAGDRWHGGGMSSGRGEEKGAKRGRHCVDESIVALPY